jgi:hypothetical protein
VNDFWADISFDQTGGVLARDAEGVGKFGGVFAAGLGEIGPASPAAASGLGGLADPVAGLEPFGAIRS